MKKLRCRTVSQHHSSACGGARDETQHVWLTPSVTARRLMATLLGVLSQLGCSHPFSRSSALSQHWALPSHAQARKRHLTQGLVFKGCVHSVEFRETLNNTTRSVSWSRAQAEVRHTGGQFDTMQKQSSWQFKVHCGHSGKQRWKNLQPQQRNSGKSGSPLFSQALLHFWCWVCEIPLDGSDTPPAHLSYFEWSLLLKRSTHQWRSKCFWGGLLC